MNIDQIFTCSAGDYVSSIKQEIQNYKLVTIVEPIYGYATHPRSSILKYAPSDTEAITDFKAFAFKNNDFVAGTALIPKHIGATTLE